MTTPIKVLVSEFQARKMATENTAVIIQVRRRKGQPTRKYEHNARSGGTPAAPRENDLIWRLVVPGVV